MFKKRLQQVKEGLHRCIEGGRVGDDGSEVVGEDCSDDDGPRWHSGATESEGGRAPLLLLLPWPPPRWEESSPSGPWSPWRRRGESPSEIGSPSVFSSFSRSPDVAENRFLYCGRSVTPIVLRF